MSGRNPIAPARSHSLEKYVKSYCVCVNRSPPRVVYLVHATVRRRRLGRRFGRFAATRAIAAAFIGAGSGSLAITVQVEALETLHRFGNIALVQLPLEAASLGRIDIQLELQQVAIQHHLTSHTRTRHTKCNSEISISSMRANVAARLR